MGDEEHAKKGSRSCNKWNQEMTKNMLEKALLRERETRITLNFSCLIYSHSEWAAASAHHTRSTQLLFDADTTFCNFRECETRQTSDVWGGDSNKQPDTVYDSLWSVVLLVNVTWVTSGRRSHPLVMPLLVTHPYILWCLIHHYRPPTVCVEWRQITPI